MFILCIVPPPNRAKDIATTQRRFLERFASASSLALPPLIPLSSQVQCFAEPTQRHLRQPSVLAVDGWMESGRYLCLRVTPESTMERIVEEYGGGRRHEEQPSDPCGWRYGFLVSAEGRPAGTLPDVPRGSWGASSLECLEINGAPPPDPWWTAVTWRVAWRRPLRKPRDVDGA